MPGNPACTVYIGNLDERVSDRVLYDILIQVGRVVDLYIPRDKETNRPKGYAFAEYETEEIADYAVRLFSGLVTLYNRTLKLAISGQEKSSQNSSATMISTLNSPLRPRSHPVQFSRMETFQHSVNLEPSSRSSAYLPNYRQEPAPPGVVQSNGYRSDFDHEVSGAVRGSTTYSSSRRYDARNSINYTPY
ncbi:hypothetical protein L1049_021072 [Liquidambar formosana]|uniref:RRM domain-containing protein n=1 Tax=Liquidambar formosana TaxID=63359 RepID=A0AAP0SDL0_LIQFO